jgi:hypothetical protein
MTGYRNPKDPLNVPKSVRLRDRAGAIKGRADALLREADALLAEAEALEASEPGLSDRKPIRPGKINGRANPVDQSQ